MRTYEALYIVSPDPDDNAIHTVVANVERLVTEAGGTIVRSDVWGKRKLAYEIKKHSEGVYVLLRFTANPEFVKRFEQQLKLMDAVIRFMVLYLDAHTLKLEDEQQKRNEEELRAGAARRSRRGADDDEENDEDDVRMPARRGSREDRDDDMDQDNDV